MECKEGKRNHVLTLTFSSTLELEAKNFRYKNYKWLNRHNLGSKPEFKLMKSTKWGGRRKIYFYISMHLYIYVSLYMKEN